ncbi:AraC family transcriptional regulator [Flavobacterium akiainvivens]|uniref:histidine kinase n=1 Tax=Flavobacterium akiainvivens TaxID=1202724 RepID=A0A0M9VHL3_9FLAO|nr:substrate-binding domain-containing protein [Flavobacterium akiainvivens]KOS05692.1 AraC family transcriptional regulator [Flavobacterium akiainvivens]SFQ36757.1 monosaccharide ABC transporter substrate-binding protein, CUT2 family [Flavobacterium akiainvivens]
MLLRFIKHLYTLFCIAVLFTLFSGCTQTGNVKTIKIGFSQAMTTDEWRRQMNKSMQVEASLHPEVALEIKDAQNNVAAQIKDIESFIANGVDVIIVSPIEAKPLSAVIQKAISSGIPVLAVDRKTDNEAFTAFLGADNIEVGRNAASYIVANTTGNVDIIEITGLKTSSPAYERSLGFSQVLARNSRLHLTQTVNADWEEPAAKTAFKQALQANPNTQYVFAHNDRMALGAWQAAKELGLDGINIIGVDALNTPNGGIELVKQGVLTATLLYPNGGNEAIRLAMSIYKREPFAKNNLLSTIVVDRNNADIIKNQADKVAQQQQVIENQLKAIKVQEQEFASQNLLVKLLTFFLVIIFSLAVYSIYSTLSLSQKKKQLEATNTTVTSQKNEIEAMAAAARHANEARLGFFTGLSHEFKTPLTLIMSYAESLSENNRVKSTPLTDEVKLIYNNSERLLRLVNQLLDFRQVEEQKLSLHAAPANLYDFTLALMAHFKGEATRRNIAFTVVCSNQNIEAYIDRNLMDKVYFNLMGNAFKFTPDNGTITISLTETPDDVQVTVKDSGIGIPEKELQLIFNPFYRASNNTRNSSGIGLSISREFVQLHGGTLEATSHHGAAFTLTLQKGSTHLAAAQITTAQNSATPALLHDIESEVPPVAHRPAAEKHTLLVVEDHPDLVNFLSSKLSDGYEVLTSDGTDAVTLALHNIPDIIICDVNLNGTDGFEISRTLKKDLRTSHIPILMLTALSNKESVLKGLQAGADGYLTKPFSLAVLQQSLENLLYNREKLRYYYTNNIYKIATETRFGNAEQDFVTKMNGVIAQNMDNPAFSVEELAEKMGVSRVQLYRKVKALMGISISDHINNIRLEKASEMLKNASLNVSEVAYALGYSSPNYFSTAFKNKFGVSPKDYR